MKGREPRERSFLCVPSIWMQPWSEDARYLAFYLMTCRHRATEGLYLLPLTYAAADMKWPARRVRKAFDELLADEFIEYDDATEMVLLVGALEIQAPANPNVDKAAVKALASFPKTVLFARLHQLAEQHCKRFAEALVQAFPERCAKSPSPTPSPTPFPPNPPQAGGVDLQVENGTGKANPRALGTNQRAVGLRLAARRELAHLELPSEADRERFDAVRDGLREAMADQHRDAWTSMQPLELVGTDDGVLIIDSRDPYALSRFGQWVDALAGENGCGARVITDVEHQAVAAGGLRELQEQAA